MTNQHPITPPPELVKQWCHDSDKWTDFENVLSIRAARWGADQELEACREWLDERAVLNGSTALRYARRPQPSSLKEKALLQLDTLNADPAMHDTGCYLFQMRRALEALPND